MFENVKFKSGDVEKACKLTQSDDLHSEKGDFLSSGLEQKQRNEHCLTYPVILIKIYLTHISIKPINYPNNVLFSVYYYKLLLLSSYCICPKQMFHETSAHS